MPTRRLCHLLAALLAGALCLVACSDDDPVSPHDESFAVAITVVDSDGQPLVDEPVHLLPSLPSGTLPIGKSASRIMPPAVVIPLTLPVACLVDLEIRDVAGAAVRALLDGYEAPAGQHHVVWNGAGDGGALLSGGWFEAVLTCRDADADTVVFTDSRSMLLVTFDQDDRAHGTTDAAGRVTIADRRVVPAFWDLPPMTFTDENGDITGTYELTTQTWIWAANRLTAFVAVDGPQSVTVQQAPPPPKAPAGMVGPGPSAIPVRRDAPPVDELFELGDPFPNPFN